jgi:hypothetical protein
MGSVFGNSIKFENVISFKSGDFVLCLASYLCVSMQNITRPIIIFGIEKIRCLPVVSLTNLIFLTKDSEVKKFTAESI